MRRLLELYPLFAAFYGGTNSYIRACNAEVDIGDRCRETLPIERLGVSCFGACLGPFLTPFHLYSQIYEAQMRNRGYNLVERDNKVYGIHELLYP